MVVGYALPSTVSPSTVSPSTVSPSTVSPSTVSISTVSLSDAEVDRLFHALADATRRNIVTRVLEREQSVSALAEHYAMSFAAVQKHVAVLESASLVAKVRRGREQIVHGEPITLQRASLLLDGWAELWAARVVRMDDILAGASPHGK
jgi:DNA-binding transcriptional ArsR family regulator